MAGTDFTADIAVVVAAYIQPGVVMTPVEALVCAQLHVFLQMNKEIQEQMAKEQVLKQAVALNILAVGDKDGNPH